MVGKSWPFAGSVLRAWIEFFDRDMVKFGWICPWNSMGKMGESIRKWTHRGRGNGGLEMAEEHALEVILASGKLTC